MSIEAEIAVVTQQKVVAQKDLKTAQSGFLAKIFQLGKYKNVEAARLKESYNEGVKDTINSFVKAFGLKWNGCTNFRMECVTNWTKLFAKKDNMYDSHAINKFISFIDYMSCSAKTNVTTVGSNGCADQLNNWDGTQKIGLGALPKKKRGMSQ